MTSTSLSVNLNKVALVRNTRQLGIPSLTRAATLCLGAGAAGITVHPRPDARHIRAQDVIDLAQLLTAWPDREFNVEGNPFHNLLDCVRDLRSRNLPVHQVTFVPDSEGQFTSDHGWDFPADTDRLRPLVQQARALGLRVSVFMDADAAAMPGAAAVGAHRVELYTEPYAAAWGGPEQEFQLQRFAVAARAAHDAGLEVNAGHDLSLQNLGPFLQRVASVKEVSIGHALISDALEMGYAAAVTAYLACIAR
jgi:pyridoxine 5-phosphate synthase